MLVYFRIVVYLHLTHAAPNIHSNFSEYHLTYEVITSKHFPETKEGLDSLQTVPQRQFIPHFSVTRSSAEEQP